MSLIFVLNVITRKGSCVKNVRLKNSMKELLELLDDIKRRTEEATKLAKELDDGMELAYHKGYKQGQRDSE